MAMKFKQFTAAVWRKNRNWKLFLIMRKNKKINKYVNQCNISVVPWSVKTEVLIYMHMQIFQLNELGDKQRISARKQEKKKKLNENPMWKLNNVLCLPMH